MNGPKIEVLQYFNNVFTISDKGNDFHRGAERGTNEGVDFIDLINKASPGRTAGGSMREYRSMGVSEYRGTCHGEERA